MKKIISLFVIATMIVAAMSISTSAADVTSTAQFVFDGTVNKLTADIMGADRLTLSNASDNLVVDLNGFTWQSDDIVIKIDNGATVEIYDSSEAKTGKIKSGNDAIDMSNGTLTLKNITVEGGDDACDAIFANGGTITVEGCTLSGGKAGIDSSNGSAAAGVPVVATVKDTTFANYANPGDRNCAIELRASSDDQVITLVGNNIFTNNKIMMRDDYKKGAAAGIVAGEGATVSFTDPAAVAGRNNYTYSEITYTYTAPAALDYYLIGYINGADYGCEADWENLGEYKFVDGKLTATFTQDSYIFVKASDNAHWYMAEAYIDNTATSGTFKNTSTGTSEKMFVPGNVELEFTLVDNGDDTFTISYEEVVNEGGNEDEDEDNPETGDAFVVVAVAVAAFALAGVVVSKKASA